MKTTKKALSVLLAVIMIMSSMSVCFGCEVFAATSETTEFIEAVQCDAMKNFSATYSTKSSGSNPNLIRTNTYSVTAANYTQFLELIEVIKAFDNAVQSLGEYTNKHSHSNDSNCAASTTVCTDFGALRTALVNDIGTSTYNTLNSTYNLGAFLDCVLSMTNITYARSLNKYHESTGWSYSAAAPKQFFNDLVVNVDYMSYFTSKTDTDELTDDEIYTTYTYRTAMGRQLWTAGKDWLQRTKYRGHSCVNTFQIGYFSQHTEGTTTATNRAVLQDMKTALENNKDYLDETTIAGVHAISTNPATLNAVAKEIEDAYTALKNKLGTNAQTLFDHFFKADYISYGTSVDNLIALIKKAAVIAGYKSSCETIAKDYKIYTDETYKTYTSTEVNALYNELKTAYEGYKAADDSLEAEIATYYGINGYIADIPTVLADLLAYYYEIFLGSIDERAFGTDDKAGYVETWQLWTVEDIDNDVVTSADILTALNEVSLDIDTLNSDASEEDVQGYFGMPKAELIGILTTVKTYLEYLGYYAGLNDQLYAQYATFTNSISGVIDADSSTLYNVLSGYEAWHQNLQTFFTTWSNEVGEYKDLLEDDLQATMNTYMQEAYAALKARVVTQIDNAYGLYEVYYDMYGNNVTMASLTYFNTLKKAIDAIEHSAYNWMKSAHHTYGTAIDATSIARYDALQVIYNAYGTFVANRGFDTYTETVVDTVREDTDKDIARENANIDADPQGEYVVKDEDINKVIDLLEAALKDENIKKLLGDLINKENLDENGNPKPFDLAELINGLINDNLYSDNIVNTIISFLYPVVAKAFLDVWIGIDPVVNTTAETDMGNLPVSAKLLLYDVDTAIEAAGLALAPANLGNFMAKNGYASKYPTIIAQLQAVTAKTRYAADGTYADPWKAADLYEDAVDEEGNVIIDEETGEAKRIMALDWGIDEAEDKKAAFIDATCAALCGLEPLLKALLLNQKFVSPNIENDKQRGGKIGTSLPGTTVEAFGLTLNLTLDPITLMLDISANDGYDNVLAPLFELLGLTNIPHGESMSGVRDFLEKGLLAMVDQLVNKVAANPIKTILDIVPNLVYALEADLVAPVLNFLETNIYYEADTHYSANAYITQVTGDLAGVMKAEKPEYINVGQMLDLESMGLNLSGGLAGILEMLGISIPMPDVSVLATAGELVWKDTNRSRWTYSYQPAGVSGKAAYIQANRADVLEYLVKYALGNLGDLLGAFGLDTSGLGEVVGAIFDNLAKNADAATAGVVELLNQKAYNTLKTYEWFNPDTYALPTVEGFTPATQIYMNPGNDWTEEKAQYLYDNLEAILGSIFTMANLDLDKETEGVQTSLEDLVGGLIDGLLTDKTLTALAGILAKLDLNALIAPKADEEAAEGEGEEAEEAAALEIDLNGLVKSLLDVDLAAVAAEYADVAAALEADPEYVYAFGVDAAEDKAAKFVDELVKMLTPLSKVLDFVLTGGTLDITFARGTADAKSATLLGGNGYNTALIPLLEALGCEVTAQTTGIGALEATLDALVGLINKLTTNDPAVEKDGLIYGVIDLLPGLLYFLSSDGLTTAVYNLLHPVYVILDTIRPIYDLDINALLAGIEIGEEGNKKPLGLNLDKLNTEFVIKLVSDLTGLNLTGLNTIIYDVCKIIGVEYTSASTLQTTWKKGAYNADFDQADLLTVVLSFILEWATVKENAEKLDELLKTEGLISSITTVLAGVKVNYADPDWMYWFDTKEEFNNYIANGSAALPNTLLALEYPNDWNEVTAQYIADNLANLVDMVIGLINKDKEDAPKTVADLLGGLLNGYLTKDSLNQLVDLIVNLLSNIDATLIETAGVLLDANIAGLETYEAPEIVATADKTLTEAFAAELANVLDTYAGRLINWLFFEDSYEFARKSTGDDTIVINGGLGYEKGLAMILEALGCELPANPDVYTVLDALAKRVDEILAAPVDEVIELLPNLVYFLNANGAGVAVSNLLAPVVALLDALAIEGVKLDLAELIKITKEDGSEVKLNLSALTLANIVDFVEKLTGLNLEAVEKILVDFCVGKIEKATYTYKMTADKSDVVTIVLTTALLVLKNEQNADVIGVDAIAALDEVFKSAPVTYGTPNWDYCWDETDIDHVYGTIGVIESALNYPNDWTKETSQYVAANLSKLVDMVIGLIEIDGTKYESLAALIDAKLNIYTADNLKAIQTALGDLIGGLDGDLKNIVDVALGAADSLLGADVNGLLNYNVEGADGKEAFVNALTGMLMEVEGLVDWLLLGEDYELFVDDDGDMVYEDGEAIITLNGGHGYAEGLALLLEALGCEDLPTVYDKNTIDTEATVKAVLTSLANRIDEVLDNPVDEVINLLPNLIYFLNTNGVAAVIDNLIGAINALLIKLEGVGLEVNINDLVNIKELMGIEGTDAAISLDNLAMKDILQAVSLMTGLDLTVLEGTLNGFALGNVQAYPSVSRTGATFKMQYEDAFDKADMITVLVTAVLNVLETGDNAEKIDEMANTNLVSAIRDVFMGGTVVYTAPNWDYTNDTKYEVKYPNNWTEATAEYVADNLVEIGDMIAGLIDANYATLGELLTDKVNVFTTDNLDKLVELINNLLGDIDATLIEGAGLLLGAKLVGDDSLATYKAPAGIDTAEEFAAELANVLSTYAPGVVEWLFLGESYKFFVNDANGDDEFNNGKYTEGEDVITINGAQGYAEGLALLLEALGCEDLPAVYDAEGNALELDTADTIEAVLVSLGKRIDYILANPVVEVVNLLPNLFYFLNTNGVAAIVDNLTAGITALLGKLEAFGVKLDINELVNLKKLMGLEDTDATISLDNLAMKDILQAVSLMVGIDLTYIEKVLVNFNLGEVAAYDSVSQYAGTPKKMSYVTTFEDHDMITVIANLLLITLADAKNEAVIKELLGADIYAVIIDVLNLETAEAPIQYMDWKATDRVGDTFNALETSPTYKGFEYGPLYTEEMAQYIADNSGEFIDNIIYLLGLNINGVSVDSLEELLSGLIGGSLYNSDLVITIRDAIAGLASGIEGLEVNGKVVGNHIVEILKTAEIADLKKVANVNVPEFSDDKAQFIASLCDVLEPLYPVLTWLLADTDLAFFVDTDMSDFITLPGAEGYRNGIALLLEAIGCENLPTELNGEGEAVVLAILNPLLTRLDEILANPAEEILGVLTNVIYFINSNGIDVVIKNTLNAVYTVLAAIEPIAKVDLYELVGLDAIVTLSAEELIDMLLSKLEVAGFDFTAISVDLFSELTVGKLTQYTSISAEGKNAYKMVYDAENANEADMVTAVLRLVITFILTDNNRNVLIDLLKDALGMSADAEKYVRALLDGFADVVVGKEGEDLRLGMDTVLATIYYLFYGADVAVDNIATGKKDLNEAWQKKLAELSKDATSEETDVSDLITDIFDIMFNPEGEVPEEGGNDVLDKDGLASNGFLAFFARIKAFFQEIADFFRNLFSFGK